MPDWVAPGPVDCGRDLAGDQQGSRSSHRDVLRRVDVRKIGGHAARIVRLKRDRAGSDLAAGCVEVALPVGRLRPADDFLPFTVISKPFPGNPCGWNSVMT
jgi:hypothetical protein